MNPGFVKCPLCNQPVKLTTNGFLKMHFASRYKYGVGFHGVSNKCSASNKKLEDLT